LIDPPLLAQVSSGQINIKIYSPVNAFSRGGKITLAISVGFLLYLWHSKDEEINEYYFAFLY